MYSRGGVYPVFLVLKGAPVLMVGGGEVAFRKAVRLIDTGCELTVVAPALVEAFDALLNKRNFHWEARPYNRGEAGSYLVVFCATDDPAINEHVYQDAVASGRLVNVADKPDRCTFFVPSTVERGSLKIAVSTSGKCPALSRHVRIMLEQTVPERYGLLLEQLTRIRSLIRQKVRSETARRVFLQRIVSSRASEAFLTGNEALLEKIATAWSRARPR